MQDKILAMGPLSRWPFPTASAPARNRLLLAAAAVLLSQMAIAATWDQVKADARDTAGKAYQSAKGAAHEAAGEAQKAAGQAVDVGKGVAHKAAGKAEMLAGKSGKSAATGLDGARKSAAEAFGRVRSWAGNTFDDLSMKVRQFFHSGAATAPSRGTDPGH